MYLSRRSFCFGFALQAIAALLIVATFGCSGEGPAPGTDTPPTPAVATSTEDEPNMQEPDPVASVTNPDESVPSEEPGEEAMDEPVVEPEPPTPETVAAVEPTIEPTIEPAAEPTAEPTAERPSLDDLLADLEIPPPWLEQVQTQYDTSQPWKEARLEIRRLLGFGKTETHREAVKLMWIYLQKDDMGDGHEYPMYTLLGGEPLWSVRAHQWYLAKPHANAPLYGYVGLASLYARYGEFEKGKALLDDAMNGLPGPPWQIMRKADIMDAYGDLYAAWGKPDEAKKYYAQAIELYPTAKPPYGGHLLPRRAAKVQSKLDLLTFRSLETAELRDGQYQEKALGYAGDVHVTLVVENGKIADIKIRHEEKIDQNACTLVPQRIIDSQSLQVDAVSGATVTKDAIVNGAYRCLKKAGLN
ncbi:MAG: FMN-binding protein [Pirellulaceae bacterium]|nr:FMN-binding protein [Pirellulaceae bacterium]